MKTPTLAPADGTWGAAMGALWPQVTFWVPEGKSADLERWPTHVKRAYKSKKKYHKLLDEQVDELTALQRFTTHRTAMPCSSFFRAWTPPEKTARRQVMSGVNPQGCQVFSFKQPSAEELEHDFSGEPLVACRSADESASSIALTTRRCSSCACILSFLLLRDFRRSCATRRPFGWSAIGRSSRLENHLHRNGTRIIKIFLHQSKDTQLKRFMKRIDDPDRNWKLTVADVEERRLWKRYMKAYEACFSKTSTGLGPWYVVPADDKKDTRLIVSKIILDVFKGLAMAYPKAGAKRRRELHIIRTRLDK